MSNGLYIVLALLAILLGYLLLRKSINRGTAERRAPKSIPGYGTPAASGGRSRGYSSPSRRSRRDLDDDTITTAAVTAAVVSSIDSGPSYSGSSDSGGGSSFSGGGDSGGGF